MSTLIRSLITFFIKRGNRKVKRTMTLGAVLGYLSEREGLNEALVHKINMALKIVTNENALQLPMVFHEQILSPDAVAAILAVRDESDDLSWLIKAVEAIPEDLRYGSKELLFSDLKTISAIV